MDYNLFSRTQQIAGRNQQHVFGNPHNNASAGYGYPSKPDGVLNRIHTANHYDNAAHRFKGANRPDYYEEAYQPQNDYRFYQADYGRQQVDQQQIYDAGDTGGYQQFGQGRNQQNWRPRGREQTGRQARREGRVDQWQNTIQNYQGFNNWQQADSQVKAVAHWQNNKQQGHWQVCGGKRHAGNRLDRQENLEFKYRFKNEVVNCRHLVYSKNLIPDISALSRSEPSVKSKKRKRSVSNSDLEAEVSDYISEDIEVSRRRRETRRMQSVKPKSQADAEFSGLANIKIEGLIQKKLGLKQHDKKSGGPTGTDKVSNGNSASINIPKGAVDLNFLTPKKPELKGKKKGAHETQTHPAKPKLEKSKPEKEVFKSSASYNKEELVATLRELIRSRKFDPSKVQIFDKFDDELKKVVKYVKINVAEITEFNDYFISVKPENAQRPGKENHVKKEPLPEEQKKITVPVTKNRQAVGEGVPRQNKTSYGQQPGRPGVDDLLEGQLSVLEQAMHKTMTGKLQRNIKKMSDDEKVVLFKQLKGNLDELATDQYGRYVLALFIKTNLTAIVDALIAYFDKRIMDIIKHKDGLLFSQSLIDLKFKDVRLRRSLKRIDGSLAELMADQHASLVVLIYANQLPSSDMEDFVEYCKKEYRVCLGNPTACKVFAKVFGKVSDVDRLEIELNLKTIIPQIFDGGYGKELVEVFFTKADAQNQQPLMKTLFDNLSRYLTDDDFDYFFSKIIDLKKADLIDTLMTKLFESDTLSDKQMVDLINNETGYRTILSFFTLASLAAKGLMRDRLARLRQAHGEAFNGYGKKVLTLCDNYFSASSK